MTQSVTESSISPGPLSPFSTYSVASGITSDDAPDLGAFGDVFRALTNLRTSARTDSIDMRNATPTSSFLLSQSDDSGPLHGPSLWPQRRVASYRATSAPGSPIHGRSSSLAPDDSTASEYDDGTEQEVPIVDVISLDRPSLGLLDETLTYIAAERERLTARPRRDMRGNVSTSDSASQLLIPPTRRKRRRTRTRLSRRGAFEDGTHIETIAGGADGVDEVSADNEDGGTSSSSLDQPSSSPHFKTVPATPALYRKQKQKQLTIAQHNPRLHHSRSVPSLGLHDSTNTIDARTIQLRTLAHKLRLLFPSEAKALSTILSRDFTSLGTSADPRGPVPQPQDTLIHVFIDHSNILIGFLSHVKKHLLHHIQKTKKTYLSHAALSLVLERGRPVTRRVLVTSSPLYQPMDCAKSLDYEVCVYARVLDTGEGTDRQHNPGHSRTNSRSQNSTNTNVADAGASRARSRVPPLSRGHVTKTSVGGGNGTSTESDQGNGSGASAARTRYREQGVDELLQLKVHHAIADVDVVPPGGTIVLATGDGNISQFNLYGFIGCVRTALKMGWRVELYAWEGGLSRAWSREFGENEWFKIILLDDYAADLLEIPGSVAGGH